MKQMVAVVVVVAVLAVVGYTLLMREAERDDGFLVGFAVGSMNGPTGELHVIISREMTNIGPPRRSPNGTVLWQEWAGDHFDLRGADGQSIRLVRAGTSSIIRDYQSFNPEFFLTAVVRVGDTYTLDYIPETGQPRRYRYTFTVPPDGLAFSRQYFQLAPGN